MVAVPRVVGLAMLLSALSVRAVGEDITNAIHALLQHRVEVEKQDVGMVVGLVDEHGSRVISCGKLDNGTGGEVNGDTLFEIGSITKTFTGLLLQDMVERGEMKLDDPVARYLPKSFTMPTHHGKEITLLHLATHTSGLPLLPSNLNPKRADNPYADYTEQKLKDFLAGYQLPQEPGTKYVYSELGMELLGYVLALKAGTNFESLVVDRICRPLQMDSTRATLTAELKSRLATGHDVLGQAVPGLSFQTLVGGSGLHSTANDLLKYLSANLGLAPCTLTTLMEKTHAVRYESTFQGVRIALAWAVVPYPNGRRFLVHGGGTPGYTTFVGFDKARRRGVVLLSSSNDIRNVAWLGLCLLESEWRSDRRPVAANLSGLNFDAYAGEYRLSRDVALGMLTLRAVLTRVTKTAFGVVAGACVVAVVLPFFLCRIPLVRRLRTRLVLRWRAFSSRARLIILGGALLVIVFSAVLTPLVAAEVVWVFAHPVVDIRREGSRLFVQGTSLSRVKSRVVLPHITGELLPESDARFFERVSGTPMTFSRDGRSKVARLTVPLFGTELSFVKISDQAPEPPKPPVAVRLDPELLDACVGQYEFAADRLFPDGFKLTIWREGGRLLGRATDKNGGWGAFDLYPESETNFFFTMTIIGVQLTFIKNDQGEVTSVIRHVAWWPDRQGKRTGN